MPHTPGPWKAVTDGSPNAIEAKPYGLLAAVRYLGNSKKAMDEYASNTVLMAASPDMKKALDATLEGGELLLSQCTPGSDVADVLNSFVPLVRAAIKKATEIKKQI